MRSLALPAWSICSCCGEPAASRPAACRWPVWRAGLTGGKRRTWLKETALRMAAEHRAETFKEIAARAPPLDRSAATTTRPPSLWRGGAASSTGEARRGDTRRAERSWPP